MTPIRWPHYTYLSTQDSTKVYVLYEDGREECVIGWCTNVLRSLRSVAKYTVKLSEQKLAIIPEERSTYFHHLEQWGFGKFHVHIPWEVKASEVNITKWFATFSVLRYMWETPSLIRWWYDMVYHYPDLDPWLLFTVGHGTYCGNTAGHGIMSLGNTGRVDPVKVLNSLGEITGFDWSKCRSLQNTFNRGLLKYSANYMTELDWRENYDRLAVQST